MADTQPDADASFTPPEPGPEHRALQPFVGIFRATVSLYTVGPDPMVTYGEMTNRFRLGGFFLQQTFVGDLGPDGLSRFEGQGYWGYNQATGLYEGFWIDTASSIMQTETGSVDETGKIWTMTASLPHPEGGTIEKRAIISLIDDDHHTMESLMSFNGAPETRTMFLDYVRTGA